MTDSKYSAEEIERERRKQTSKKRPVDEVQLQAGRDFLSSARIDTPEEFQARLLRRGVEAGSDRFKRAMEAYWAIRRDAQR